MFALWVTLHKQTPTLHTQRSQTRSLQRWFLFILVTPKTITVCKLGAYGVSMLLNLTSGLYLNNCALLTVIFVLDRRNPLMLLSNYRLIKASQIFKSFFLAMVQVQGCVKGRGDTPHLKAEQTKARRKSRPAECATQ